MADKTAKDTLDFYIRLQSATFDQASRYTNLIVAAGYGAFFGLWSMTKNYLTPTQARLAAVSMLFSATVFVLFEVYKVGSMAIYLSEKDKIFRDPLVRNDLNLYIEKMEEREVIAAEHNNSFVRVWKVVLALTVASAFFAVLVLLYSFMFGLFIDP